MRSKHWFLVTGTFWQLSFRGWLLLLSSKGVFFRESGIAFDGFLPAKCKTQLSKHMSTDQSSEFHELAL